MAKVSVIIPVYNAEKTISFCLDALINQTFKDFEVICINDGSKDNSLQILTEYAQKDSRIKVYNQENCGPAKTRYNAIKESNGKYLMFCDADDWYEINMIEQMCNTITEQNVDLVMCDCRTKDLSNGIFSHWTPKDYLSLKKKGYSKLENTFYKDINGVLWNKIFKKDILDLYNIEYPQQYEHDDLMFVYKYCLCSNSYFGLNKKLYNYVVGNPNSIMGKVYTKTNIKNPFDFILAFSDLYSFFDKQAISERIKLLLVKHHFSIIREYYNILNQELKEETFTCLKTFINENPIMLKNESFKKIIGLSSYNEFHQIMTNEHKVIRILGIKIKFKKRGNDV